MAFQGDSIYWVEVEKIVPNPFQPRREFDENKLRELSESIRMYGVLQPLTVTRKEVQREDGTFFSEYELIAGERRLRASKLAGVAQVPVIIREGEDSEQEKLELAIIENLQREDLNAIDRALAFQQLAEQFNLTHAQVGKKVGRSREYVANSIRLLQLPQHMRDAVQRGELGEGHARTLLMLGDKPEEQETIFREVLLKNMSVRELERIARKIATDKVRKPHQSDIDQHLIDIEKEFTETLGTRVQIQKTDFGGKLTIDYFSEEDLAALLDRVRKEQAGHLAQQAVAPIAAIAAATPLVPEQTPAVPPEEPLPDMDPEPAPVLPAEPTPQPVQEMPPTPPAVGSVTAHTTPQHTVPTPPTPSPAPVASQASPTLLERLSAHAPLSFASTPATQSVVEEVPSVESSQPVAAPEATQSTPDTPPPAPADKPEEDEQLYSMRNFTV